VTGAPFQQLARELVLEPLGMSDSDYAQPLPPALHDKAATAHDELGQPVPGLWHSYPELAAAGLWTTPTDLLKFAVAVQQTYAGAEGALLSPAISRELLTPQIAATDRIGGLSQLGLGLFLDDGGVRFGHSGGNKGFRCHVLAYRDTGQGAAVMTNGDNGSWVVQRAFAAIARTYGWDGYSQEVDEPDLPTDETMARLTGAYRLDGRLQMDVARWGSGLAVTFAGQPSLRFMASSTTRFAAVNTDTELEVRDDGSRLVFIQGGAELDCSRE
jgi:CubicO group peptidase (beta-lactamase class C family)